MATTSPTQLTLKKLRAEGFTAEIVEHWLPWAKRRRDLFDCIDVLALHADHFGLLGVQTTSASNHAARRVKALANPTIELWVRTGNRFEVWSWSKRKDKSRGRLLWTPRVEPLALSMFTTPSST